MLLRNVLTPNDVESILSSIPRSKWVDGAISAGRVAQKAKLNLTLHPDDQSTQDLVKFVRGRLETNHMFKNFVVPAKIADPQFLMYEEGMSYGRHLDAIFMGDTRTDLSYTIFLSDAYEGGELAIETAEGTHEVRGGVGDMYLYEAGRIHEVREVKKGLRVVAVGWVQSRVPDAEARAEMFRLKLRIDRLVKEGKNEEILENYRLYNFLLRRFSQN